VVPTRAMKMKIYFRQALLARIIRNPKKNPLLKLDKERLDHRDRIFPGICSSNKG
jgi:hypothetical protein